MKQSQSTPIKDKRKWIKINQHQSKINKSWIEFKQPQLNINENKSNQSKAIKHK